MRDSNKKMVERLWVAMVMKKFQNLKPRQYSEISKSTLLASILTMLKSWVLP